MEIPVAIGLLIRRLTLEGVAEGEILEASDG
jgi:hypothetical protein